MTTKQDAIIGNARLVLADRVVEQGWVAIVDGKIAEFSAYLMAFADRQDAVDHALPEEGERVAPVMIRIGEAAP